MPSGGLRPEEETHQHAWQAQYFVAQHAEKSRNCHPELQQPCFLLDFFRLLQLDVGHFCVLVGDLEIFVDFLKVLPLLLDHQLDLLHHLQVLLHLLCDLVDLLGFDSQLRRPDFPHDH